jgi:hypothetical protein
MDKSFGSNIEESEIDGFKTWLFSYAGSPQIFTSSEGGIYKFEVWGGQGGDGS